MSYTIYPRKVPAYISGELTQYLAGHNGMVTNCADLALRMFERQAEIKGARDELVWSILKSATRDALYPTRYNETKPIDQDEAFQWFASDEADEILEHIGLNSEWVNSVIIKLSDVAETS